jgi:general secretion pathway protein D
MTCVALFAVASFPLVSPLSAQRDGAVTTQGDSVTIRLIDVDVRAAVEVLSPYLDRPIVFGDVNAGRVTLQTPKPIARGEVFALLRSALESQNLEIIADSTGPYRIRAKAMAPPPVPPQMMAVQNGQGGANQLFVIRLSHARAPDVAATINALYGRASALGELGRNAPPMTLSQELTQQQMAGERALQPGGTPQQYGVPGGNGNGSNGQNRSGTLSQETTIVPDLGTNSLLIRATQADYDLILAAVKEIDVRPLQVLIEMLVAEVRKDRSFNFGVSANLPQQTLGNPVTSIGGSQTGIGLGDLVIRVMGLGGIKDFDVTLRAAASRGDVTIVSRPAVLAANNEQAQILVGSQRPFVLVSRSLPTDGASRDQVVQYKDVGTKLIVRPTISADGYVMLEVLQEISQATSEVQFDAPVISTRSVQTRLLLKDGQTVVLGGLRDRQRERNQGGVPILSSIPLMGGFFGRASRKVVETELFLFITPRLIRNDAEAEGVTKPMQERSEKKTEQ